MAEPVGTTLGALGVLGLLSVCIDSFNFIQDGRSVGKGFTLLRGEFANLRFRLLVWCRACKFFDEGGYDARLNHPELRPQILAQLNSICLLFMDAKKVIGRYDVPPSSTQLSIPGSSAVFVEEGLRDFLKRIKDTKNRAGFRGAFLWALKDKRAFQEVIERLEKCISALELVTANLDLFAEPHVRRAVEIEIETLSDAEVLSDMVAASNSSHSGSLISDAASHRILSLRSQPGTHERSTVSSGSQTFYTAHTLHDVNQMETIAEESAFSCLDVSNPALHEVLQQFLLKNRNTYCSLFTNWIDQAWHKASEASVFVKRQDITLDAPTFHYRESPPFPPEFRDSAERSRSKAFGCTIQPDTENPETLSNDLIGISSAVQETFWGMRNDLRNKLEYGESITGVIGILRATYSKLPPIVLAACDDLFGKLPTIEVLRESQSAPPGTYSEVIQEVMFRHQFVRGDTTDGPAVENALSILGCYFDPIRLLNDYPLDRGEDVLTQVLTLRLAATSYFWALVGHLESQASDQAKIRNIKKPENNGSHTPLNEHTWGRRLLDIKRKDNEVVHPRVGRDPSSMRDLRNEVRRMAGYPYISLRLIRGHGNPPTEAIVTFEAPPQSSYAGGFFQLHCVYHRNYPCHPLKARFLTKVYHPNIDHAGKICLNFRKEWGPSCFTSTIILGICALLSDPDIDDPLVPEIASTYIHDTEEYTRCAKLYTKKYATLEAAVERLERQEKRQEA